MRIQHCVFYMQVIDVTAAIVLQQRACQGKLFKSELCCNHSQSDDLIPLNTAVFEEPCGSTKELGTGDGVNWWLNAVVLS